MQVSAFSIQEYVHAPQWSARVSLEWCACGRDLTLKLTGDLVSGDGSVDVQAWHGDKHWRVRAEPLGVGLDECIASCLEHVRIFDACF